MLTELLPTLISLAREAGQKILRIYEDPSLFERVDFKADDSPLTLADQEAHRCIAEGLEKLTPEIPLLSEEGRQLPYETRKQWQRFWLVDPLDGTKEFIKRNGEFTVNIALVEGHAPVLGVVHVPAQDLTYFASLHGGAFRQSGENLPERIQVSKADLQSPGLRIVASRSHLSPEVEAYVRQFDSPIMVSMGSSLKFTVLAEGKADVYPRLAPTMEWDTCAAQIVVEEAGGVVLEYPAGTPLRYNKENLLNPFFIAFGTTPLARISS